MEQLGEHRADDLKRSGAGIGHYIKKAPLKRILLKWFKRLTNNKWV